MGSTAKSLLGSLVFVVNCQIFMGLVAVGRPLSRAALSARRLHQACSKSGRRDSKTTRGKVQCASIFQGSTCIILAKEPLAHG